MFEAQKKTDSKIKNRSLEFCFECCKESKTIFVFVVVCTASDFHSFNGEINTFYRKSNKFSENVIKVRVFCLFRPVFRGFTLALAT